MQTNNKKHTVKFTNTFATNAQFAMKTAWEWRIFFAIVMQCNSFKEEKKSMKAILSLKELEDISLKTQASKRTSTRQKIDKILEDIANSNYIKIEDDTGIGDFFFIYSKIQKRIIDKQIFFDFELNDHMKPYIQELYTNFLSLLYPKGMKSPNAMRWLMLASAHYNKMKQTPKCKNGIVQLVLTYGKEKRILGLENKYAKFSEYKRWVIEPRIKEINTHCTLKVLGFFVTRKGRQVTHITYSLQEVVTINNEYPSIQKTSNKSSFFKTTKRDDTPDVKVIRQLTRAELKAYEFLLSKGIISGIALKQIIPNMPSSLCKGWEDEYLKISWDAYERRAKYGDSSNKAGAFVKWWTTNVFKEALFSETIEQLQALIKSKSQVMLDNRIIAKDMTNEEFEAWVKSQS